MEKLEWDSDIYRMFAMFLKQVNIWELLIIQMARTWALIRMLPNIPADMF